MLDEKNTQITVQTDFEKIYGIIYDYVESSVRSEKSKLSSKEKEGLSPDEVAKKEDELKELNERIKKAKRISREKFDSMCAELSSRGLPYLDIYIDATKKLYKEKADWKRNIKTMLVSPKSLKMFRDFRGNIVGLYPLLEKVNKTFPVDDYSELSLAPRAALYGSEVDKTQSGSTKKSPLPNEDIQAMLDAFLQVGDNNRLGDWLTAIIFFEPSQLIDGFQKEFREKRKELKEWVAVQIKINEKYKYAVMDVLLKGNKLTVLMDAFIDQSKAKAQHIELENKIKELEEQKAKERNEHQAIQEKMRGIIQENDANISALQQKVIDFERCQQQLSEYIKKYNAQVGANERIVIDNERRLSEIEAENEQIHDELAKAKARLEEVENRYSALESDFSLKSSELTRLKDTAVQKEEAIKIEVKRDLISGIKEQLDYLTMFCIDLKETGRLAPENVELFADTLDNIDHALFELGIKKIGRIEQKAVYDASIHTSADVKISNGESVVIKGCGWKIGNEVYSKAQVEKGE